MLRLYAIFIAPRLHFARTLSFRARDALLDDYIHEKYVTAFERDPATGDDVRKLSKCDIAILEVSKLSITAAIRRGRNKARNISGNITRERNSKLIAALILAILKY